MITIVIWWSTLYFSFSNAVSTEFAQQMMFPGGAIFSLVLLVLVAAIGGWISEKIFFLPPLLGMLLVGLAMRNIHPIILSGLDEKWSSFLRIVALTTILLKAGLGLDVKKLFRMGISTILLTVCPGLSEAATVMVVSYFLFGLPWIWGIMCGFVLGAVSPAVVVPSLLALQEKGFGVAKGIPTMVVAAASFDDVIAITGFGICLGIAFQTNESLVLQILHAPIEIVGGIGSGIIAGLLCWPLKWVESWIRILVVMGIGLVATFGTRELGYSGAGPLCAITLGCVAANIWDKKTTTDTAKVVGNIWTIAQPILFSLIGAAVMFTNLTGELVGIGIGIICIGLVVRITVSILATTKSGLNIKEKFFVAFAWIPKATVQAAIGGVALDYARSRGLETEIGYGTKILTVAVLSILMTAPLGAAIVNLTGFVCIILV